MFNVERKNTIATWLLERGRVNVAALAEALGVTKETIRRDLNELEKEGVAQRTHGGAVLAKGHEDSFGDLRYGLRQRFNVPGKKAIGRAAAELVHPGDTIFLDASSTCMYMGEALCGKTGVTIITNSAYLVSQLGEEEGLTVISTGGQVRRESLTLVGSLAQQSCLAYRANKAFISPKGFRPEAGAVNGNEQETAMQRCMIERAEQMILLCDHTKFTRRGHLTLAALPEIKTMITDTPLPRAWAGAMEGVRLITAKP